MSGKRGKGEGSVHKLPSGSWQSQIMDGYTDEGKRHIVSFTAPTRAEALSKLREYMLNKQTQAEEAVPEIPLFADYAQQWYESYRTQVEESTYANYRYTLKLLNGVFGHLALNEVTISAASLRRVSISDLANESLPPLNWERYGIGMTEVQFAAITATMTLLAS